MLSPWEAVSLAGAFWYFLLAPLSVLCFGLALRRAQPRLLLAVYAIQGGLTYLAEYVVLVLYSAYVYSPGVLSEPYMDNVLGAVFSDAFTIPMSIVMAVAFKFGWLRLLTMAGAIMGLEELFSRLGIYSHVWWKTWYTGAGVLLWYWFARWLYGALGRAVTALLRFQVAFHLTLLLQASLVFLLAGVLGLYRYHVGWFSDPSRDHVAFATLVVICLALIFAALITWRASWILCLVVLAVLGIADVWLDRVGVLRLSAAWSPVYFLLLRAGVLAAVSAFDRFVSKVPE